MKSFREPIELIDNAKIFSEIKVSDETKRYVREMSAERSKTERQPTMRQPSVRQPSVRQPIVREMMVRQPAARV